MIASRLMQFAHRRLSIPYVTDRLVTMWDGIWNAGVGVHDDAATTWTDITGNGYDLGITALTANVAYWGDTGFVFNKTSLGGNEYFWYRLNTDLQTRLGQTLTFEMCLYMGANTQRNYSGFNGNSGNNVNGFFSDISVARNQFEIGATTASATSGQSGLLAASPSLVLGKSTTICYSCDTSGSALYIDGESVATGDPINTLAQTEFCLGSSFDALGDGRNPSSSSYYRTPLATFYRAAVYSRKLTAAEIAKNHAIDQQRFGL